MEKKELIIDAVVATVITSIDAVVATVITSIDVIAAIVYHPTNITIKP